MKRKRFDKEDFKTFILKCLKEAELNAEMEGCEDLSVVISFYSYGPIPHENKINFLDIYLGNDKDEIIISYPSMGLISISDLWLRDPHMFEVDMAEEVVNIKNIQIPIPYGNIGYESNLV